MHAQKIQKTHPDTEKTHTHNTRSLGKILITSAKQRSLCHRLYQLHIHGNIVSPLFPFIVFLSLPSSVLVVHLFRLFLLFLLILLFLPFLVLLSLSTHLLQRRSLSFFLLKQVLHFCILVSVCVSVVCMCLCAGMYECSRICHVHLAYTDRVKIKTD